MRLSDKWASLVAQRLKHLPAMRETWVQSLGQKDTLEKEMATHSSILAWTIPWTEEPGGLQSKGRNESDTTKRLHFHLMSSSCSTFSLSGSWGPGVCLADPQSHSKGSR